MPYPDQMAQALDELKYQIFLNSQEGPVDIYLVSSSREDEGRYHTFVFVPCPCMVHVCDIGCVLSVAGRCDVYVCVCVCARACLCIAGLCACAEHGNT